MAIDGLRTCSRMACEMKQRAREPNNPSFVKGRLSKGKRGELEDLRRRGDRDRRNAQIAGNRPNESKASFVCILFVVFFICILIAFFRVWVNLS
jgi:hypothetical protein